MGITYRKFQERTRDVHLLLPGCHVLLLIATSGCIVASSTGAARGGHPPFQPPPLQSFPVYVSPSWQLYPAISAPMFAPRKIIKLILFMCCARRKLKFCNTSAETTGIMPKNRKKKIITNKNQ